MEVKTFRAASIQDALQMIREELGPDASLLEAHEVTSPESFHSREIEVVASNQVRVPSRFSPEYEEVIPTYDEHAEALDTSDLAASYRQSLALAGAAGPSLVEQLSGQASTSASSVGITTK